MVGEVVVDGDPAHGTAQFQPPLHAAEFRERGESVRHRNAHVPRRGQRRQRVQLAVAPQLAKCERSLRRATQEDRAVDGDGPIGSGTGDLREAEALDFAPAAAREHANEARLAAVDDDAAAARNRADEVVELRLDRGHVRKDVGVVEFEVVEDRRARPVVDEFRALVEERRVVLVGLDHEERAVRQSCGNREVDGHATDQESRFQSRVLKDPREHRRRRRLAVRAGNRQHPLVVQDVLVQPLRPGNVGQAGVQDRFDQRIAARDDIADDEYVGALRGSRPTAPDPSLP